MLVALALFAALDLILVLAMGYSAFFQRGQDAAGRGMAQGFFVLGLIFLGFIGLLAGLHALWGSRIFGWIAVVIAGLPFAAVLVIRSGSLVRDIKFSMRDPVAEFRGPLHKLARAAYDADDDVVRIVGAGLDPNLRGTSGLSLLAMALERRYVHEARVAEFLKTIEALLDLGADPNQVSGRLQSHLAMAAAGGPEVTKLLLDRGADPNIRNADGGPILHDSLRMARRESVKLLIERGADINAVDLRGRTILAEVSDTAKTDEDREFVVWLRAHGATL